jgi:prevent-host-death family protein
VRQVRHDFSSVLKLVQQGEDVTITLRNKPVAKLGPPAAARARPVKRPDFASRLAARFPAGAVVVGTLAERIREERDRG